MRGELEGSRGGRVSVHSRDELANRATPLSGTQLRSRPVSGFGEAALDRALADPDWLAGRLDDLNINGPRRTKDWAIAALARVPFDVCWSAAESAGHARDCEAGVLEELEDLDLWNRARPKPRGGTATNS